MAEAPKDSSAPMYHEESVRVGAEAATRACLDQLSARLSDDTVADLVADYLHDELGLENVDTRHGRALLSHIRTLVFR